MRAVDLLFVLGTDRCVENGAECNGRNPKSTYVCIRELYRLVVAERYDQTDVVRSKVLVHSKKVV